MPSCLSSLRPSASMVSILANDALSSGELFLYTALMILSTSYIRSLSLCSPSRYHLSTCRIFGVAFVPSPNSCYMNVLLTEAFQLLYPVLYKWRLSAPMIFFLEFRVFLCDFYCYTSFDEGSGLPAFNSISISYL